MAILLHLINSFAMMGAIALAYGSIQRLHWSKTARHGLLGLIFGFGAAVAMMQSLRLGPGIIVDSRALFLGFAGAFLGPLGAVVALAVAVATRLALGLTQAAWLGLCAMTIATLMGLLWPPLQRRVRMGTLVGLVLLAAMISLSLVAIAWLPEGGDQSRGLVAAMLVSHNLLGALVFGAFLQRERASAQRERALVTETQTDPLTGVLNRRSFDRRFAEADGLAQSRGTGLMIVDIDHFKRVNDVFGHEVGDRVLRTAAERLRHAVRPTDSVIRLGGEEFAVLLPDVDAQEAERAARRLQRTLALNCRIDDQRRVDITVSIGATHLRPGGAVLSEASRTADTALYRAKREGRDRAVFCPCS